MTYKMFIDDERMPPDDSWVVVRSSSEALVYIRANGMPTHMSLDHDLGGDDTTMVFLKNLIIVFPFGPIPDYVVHSANPIGRLNMISYLESWKKSLS